MNPWRRVPTWSYRAAKALHRNRVAFVTGTPLLATTLVVAAGFSMAMAWREHSARNPAEQATRRAESRSPGGAGPHTPRTSLAATLRSGGNPVPGPVLLAACFPGPGKWISAGVEWRWLSWASRDESPAGAAAPGTRHLAVTPRRDALRQCLHRRSRPDLGLADARAGDELKERRNGLGLFPHGSLLATVSPGPSFAGPTPGKCNGRSPDSAARWAFASDGHHLFGVEGGRWVRWDLDGRDRTVPAPPLANAPPNWRPPWAGIDWWSPPMVINAGSGPVRCDRRGIRHAGWNGFGEVRGGFGGRPMGGRRKLARDGRSLECRHRGTRGNAKPCVAVRKPVPFSPTERSSSAADETSSSESCASTRSRTNRFSRSARCAVTPRSWNSDSWREARAWSARFGDASVRVWNLADDRRNGVPSSRSGFADLRFPTRTRPSSIPWSRTVSSRTGEGSPAPGTLPATPAPCSPTRLRSRSGTAPYSSGIATGGLARWDLKRKNSLWSLRRGSAPLVPMAYSPSSGLLAVAEYGGRGRLHLFRPPASEPEHTFEDFPREFYEYTRKAAISPDARWLAYPGSKPDCEVGGPEIANPWFTGNVQRRHRPRVLQGRRPARRDGGATGR